MRFVVVVGRAEEMTVFVLAEEDGNTYLEQCFSDLHAHRNHVRVLFMRTLAEQFWREGV